MSTATVPATQQSAAKVSQWLRSPTALKTIESALGGTLDSEKFVSQMIIAFEKNPEVAKCTDKSKFECAYICATLGLSPTLGDVALIPRAGMLTAMPQWQGFHTLMMRSPYIKSLKARIIHRVDEYTFNAEDETLTHTYDPFADGRVFTDWKDVKGGYLVIEYNDGTPKQYHCVSVDTFKKARSCAQSDNVWKKWFYEQLLKTVYRNAFARRVVPMDQLGAERVTRLVEVTDEVEGNDPDRTQSPTQAIDAQPATKPLSRVEQAKAAKAQPVERQAEPALEADPEVIDAVVSTSNPFDLSDDEKLLVHRIDKVFTKHFPDESTRLKTYAEFGVTGPKNYHEWTEKTITAAVQFSDHLEHG